MISNARVVSEEEKRCARHVLNDAARGVPAPQRDRTYTMHPNSGVVYVTYLDGSCFELIVQQIAFPPRATQ